MSLKNKTVAYFYDQEIGNFSYGSTNPMRPHRVRLTHSLVDSYGLGSKMLVNRPQVSTAEDLERFHADGTTCDIQRRRCSIAQCRSSSAALCRCRVHQLPQQRNPRQPG